MVGSPDGAVLAIDQGTSATKAVVVDPADGVLAVAEVGIHPRYLPDGGVEQDPQELLDSVLDAGRRALAQAGRPAVTVALANQGETVLAWDRGSGRPLSPAIVWQDRRASEICAQLQGQQASFAARTGLVLDPYFSAPKMTWLRRHVTTEGVVTTSDCWLLARLTGDFVTDPTTASRSLVFDLDRVDWDTDLLDLFDLADEPRPRIADCDEVIGETSAFGAAMAVGGLVVDQQAALLGEGCWTPGAAKCTFGTGAFLLANTGHHAVRSAAGLTSSVAWRRRGEAAVYCIDGQVYTAASAVRWLQRAGLIADPTGLDEVAAAADGGSGGVLCVPALAGLAAPWWRSDATASFAGITLSSGPEHLVLAVLEGIAAQVAELTDVVGADLDRPLAALRADGGLTRSRALMTAVANLTQLPVELYPSAHATALGAAALGRMSQRAGCSLADAVPDWTPTAVYEPAWDADRADDFRSRWRALAESTLPVRNP